MFRPAGISSDEEDELDGFSFDGDVKTAKERREEIAVEIYKKRQEMDNTATNRLYTAIISSNIESVKRELDAGLIVDCKLMDDWTPLFLACSLANPIIVAELLKRGANVNINRDSFTTIMAVCNCSKKSTNYKNVLDVIEQLLRFGADAQAIDRKRRTAFMLASAQGFPEVVSALMDVSNLNAEDNQGWTALFYAVNANEPKVVSLLIDAGSSLDHLDIRNNSIKYYATLNDFQDVLNVLPKDDAELIPDDLCKDEGDFENLFEYLKDNERPEFSHDVGLLLFGMKCDHLISLFNKRQIDLSTLLNIDESKLLELGVNMSFHRYRILEGLHKLHVYPWKKRSLPVISKEDGFSSYDTYVIVATTIKHLIVMEAAIRYLKRNIPLDLEDKEMFGLKLSTLQQKIRRIKFLSRMLRDNALRYDSAITVSPDLITKDFQFKRNSMNWVAAIGLTAITSGLFLLFRSKVH